MIRINRNPSRRDLFIFGAGLATFTVLVGVGAYFRSDSPFLAWTLWTTGTALTVVYFAIPPTRLWIYLGWVYAAYPIGWTVSHAALAVVFYAVMTPTGLLMRLLGNDPMKRRFDSTLDTYWEAWEPPDDTERYFRQF